MTDCRMDMQKIDMESCVPVRERKREPDRQPGESAGLPAAGIRRMNFCGLLPSFLSLLSIPFHHGTNTAARALALKSDMACLARSLLSATPNRRAELLFHSSSPSTSRSSARRSSAMVHVSHLLLLLPLLLALTIGTRATPDFTSSLTCAVESLFIGTSTVCTWTPQKDALPINTTASSVLISSSRFAPFKNESIPIGTMSALLPASTVPASSFTFNVTAGLKTGTYLIKAVNPAKPKMVLGQFYIAVSSTQYIVLSDYVEDMSRSWQIDLPARYAGAYLLLLLYTRLMLEFARVFVNSHRHCPCQFSQRIRPNPKQEGSSSTGSRPFSPSHPIRAAQTMCPSTVAVW